MRGLANPKKIFFDASHDLVGYLMSIFKANIFLPSALSNEELALFSPNNITKD
jgi:hypothetical protein